MGKLVCGIGVNDADYVVQVKETIGYVDGKQKQRLVYMCPFYQTWKDMIKRGYSEKLKLRHKTYRDCTVCEEWHLFSTFRKWMETQDWEGKQLDKDLLVPANKVYSPETCVFVSQQVNLFLIDRGSKRGKYKIGCCWNKREGKFQSNCGNPFTGKSQHLGNFTDEEGAHQAWLAKKLEYAYGLAELQTDVRIAKALIDKYENYSTLTKNEEVN